MCIRIYFHIRSLCNFSQMDEFFARLKSNFLLKISYVYLYKCVWHFCKARIPQQKQINALAYIFKKIYKPCIGNLFLIEFSFAILAYTLTAKNRLEFYKVLLCMRIFLIAVISTDKWLYFFILYHVQ